MCEEVFEGGEYSLCQFLGSYTLPWRVKVTEGYYDPQNIDYEFSNGDVLDLTRLICPLVRLKFRYNKSFRQVTVSSKHPALFKVLPFDPRINEVSLHYRTVNDVQCCWPLKMKANIQYKDLTTGKIIFDKNDILRPIRTISARLGSDQSGSRFLECKIQGNLKLAILPPECKGNFEYVDDHAVHTLAEIVAMKVPFKRKLHLSHTQTNTFSSILGIPSDFRGNLYLETPDYFCEASPVESPGEVFVIPTTTDITVSPRDITYESRLLHQYDLGLFVAHNTKTFPLVARLTDWEEEPLILQNAGLSVGGEFVIHQEEVIEKILCETEDGIYLAIPLSYKGDLVVIPQRFSSIDDLQSKDLTVRVIEGAVPMVQGKPCNTQGLSGTRAGEVLKTAHDKLTDLQRRMENGVLMERVNCDGTLSGSLVQIPLSTKGTYEEIIPMKERHFDNISSLHALSRYPIDIKFTNRQGQTKYKNADPVPFDTRITVRTYFCEQCVVASKMIDGEPQSFYLPSRTPIQVVFTRKWHREAIPQFMEMADHGEELNRATFDGILKKSVVYEELTQKQKTDRVPFSDGYVTFTRPVRPPPLPERRPTTNVKRSNTNTPTSGPPSYRPPHRQVSENSLAASTSFREVDHHEDNDSLAEYEDCGLKDYDDVTQLVFGARGPPVVEIPEDGDISMFDWREFIVFLQLVNMSKRSVHQVRARKIDGRQFSEMDDDQLKSIALDNPIIKHFRDKSRNAMGADF